MKFDNAKKTYKRLLYKEGNLSDIDSIHRQTVDRAVEKKQKREAEV